MKSNNEIVCAFIESIWNSRELDRIDEFIADNYRDYSFLPAIPPDRNGLRSWIENTSASFNHITKVESAIEQGNEVAVRITFDVTHIGKWRGISPTGRRTSVKGFRFFRLENYKITHHWALIDGEAIQTALTDEYHGCEIPA